MLKKVYNWALCLSNFNMWSYVSLVTFLYFSPTHKTGRKLKHFTILPLHALHDLAVDAPTDHAQAGLYGAARLMDEQFPAHDHALTQVAERHREDGPVIDLEQLLALMACVQVSAVRRRGSAPGRMALPGRAVDGLHRWQGR